MRHVSTPRAAALALALAAAAAPACTIVDGSHPDAPGGGLRREFTAFRQRHGDRELAARVRLTEGTLRTATSRPGELYRVDMVYDGRGSAPVTTYRREDGVLRVERGSRTIGGPAEGDTTLSITIQLGEQGRSVRQSTVLAIDPDVETALDLALVDVESDLELGGRRLSSADITSSVGRTTIRFSRPNRAACERLALTSNVNKASLLGLGNSRCRKVLVHSSAASETVLDFGGEWSSDMAADVVATAGALTIRLPRDVGVRLTARTTLASLESSGLVRDGNTFVSRNYDQAAHRIDIDLSATLGSVAVEWIGE